MAWVKLTGKYQEFYLNMAGVRSFDRRESYEGWTRLHEYDKEEPIWVKETPEEILLKVKEWEQPLYQTSQTCAFPPTLEVLGRAYPLRKDGD